MYRPVCASQQSGGSNGLQGDVTWRELAALLGTDGLSRAVRYAFAEARRLKDVCSPLIPFTVLLGSEGIDVADHPGASPHEVMQSVEALLARELPAGYVLIYDGVVHSDGASGDALVCECAHRGDANALLVAQPYYRRRGGMVFDEQVIVLGATRQLCPRTTPLGVLALV